MTEGNNDLNLFDSIVSGEEAPQEQTPVAQPTETKPQEQARDETGKFTKVETPTNQEPVTEKPATTTETVDPNAPVPVAAIQDERKKRQDAERRAQELETRLAELEKKVAPPATQQPAVQPASLWDDPDAYLQNQINPVTSAVSELREMIMESRAEAQHGADKVAAAKQAASALFGKPEGVLLHQELMSKGGNPFSNLVEWHQRQQALATVGNDPQAWLQTELEKRMADPAFQAQVLEKARASAVTVGKSNAPRTSLPSLSSIPASGASNASQDAQSDADLFASATSGPRR